METFFITPIQKEDEPEVATLIKTIMTSFDCVGEGYSIEDPEVDHMYDAYSISGAAFMVIKDQDEKIHGCGGMAPLEEGESHICELKKMYFYESLRGKGFGGKLVDIIIQEAKRSGYTQIYLETVDRMKAANILYNKKGFKKINKALGNTGHSSCDAFYILDL